MLSQGHAAAVSFAAVPLQQLLLLIAATAVTILRQIHCRGAIVIVIVLMMMITFFKGTFIGGCHSICLCHHYTAGTAP